MNVKEQAAAFVNLAKSSGWSIQITDTVVTIIKRFEPGCREKLVECDMEYGSLLDLCPHKGGSVWGTDCGGVGAISALNSGVFRMNKSGSGAKRFAAQVLLLNS